MSPAVLYSRYNIYSGCLPGVFGIIVTICPMLKGKMEAKIPYCRVADKKNSCQTLGPASMRVLPDLSTFCQTYYFF